MSTHPSSPKPKALSLVFPFLDQLRTGEDFGGPEPDFGKWTEKQLCADVVTAINYQSDDELSRVQADELTTDFTADTDRQGWATVAGFGRPVTIW
jgi:hypothetical protein